MITIPIKIEESKVATQSGKVKDIRKKKTGNFYFFFWLLFGKYVLILEVFSARLHTEPIIFNEYVVKNLLLRPTKMLLLLKSCKYMYK